MKVLVLSHLYPSVISKLSGSFVHNQARFPQRSLSTRGSGTRALVSPAGIWVCGVPTATSHAAKWWTESRCGIPDAWLYHGGFFLTQQWRFHLKALHNAVEGVPDIVHAHCAYPDGRAAIEYGSQIGRPVVITVHGSDVKILPKLKSQWRQQIVEALTQAAAVIVVSQELRRGGCAIGRPGR